MFGLEGFIETVVRMLVSGAILTFAIWWIVLDRMPLDEMLGKKKSEKKISKKRSQNKTKKRNKKAKKKKGKNSD